LKTPRFRAVILAAGLGTRLRPLTLSLPKPLLPVAGTPVLGHTLEALRKNGCEEVAINLHYQGKKIASRFGSDFEGMPIRYSPEAEIQGTLGALAPLRKFLAEAEWAVVVNGDSLARWPLAKLLRHHQQHLPRATLMVSSRARTEDYGGGIGISRNGRVTSFMRPDSTQRKTGEPDERGDSPVVKRGVFAGAHVFSPEILKDLAEGPSDFVRDFYQPMVERDERIDAVETGEFWFDLGTPRRYLDGVVGWAGKSGLRRRGWWSAEVEVDREASVKSSVLEAGVQVGAAARIRRSLVLSGSSIGAGCRVTNAVIGFSVDLPPGTVVENRLVTEARADTPPHAKASVVGGLVYGPLGDE
jgi:NDP-sugar pyrophosphorylase family protein